MTLGEKITKLRKEHNYTQEQLSDILGVSRQAVSKWESDAAYPETEKLIRLGDLFGCSLDYLLKNATESNSSNTEQQPDTSSLFIRKTFPERKSQKTLWGLPLWHIGKKARGIIAIGINARGIIAIGMKATGVISFGMLSFGLFSIGLFTLGILCAGCFSLGIFSAGSVSIGVISLGAIAIGDFSVGALAIGKYLALGDYAKAMIASGATKAYGSIYQTLGELTPIEIASIKEILSTNVPDYLTWAKNLMTTFFL